MQTNHNPAMQTTATPSARPSAPIGLPADIAAHLAAFGLTLDGLLTDSNPKLVKGSATAAAVILHHLPHRALAAAVTAGHDGGTAPRSFLPALRNLAETSGLLPRAIRHNGCPWATAGCASGCLAWAGHGGLSPIVAAARGRRTLAMLADPALYARAVLWAIARAHARAQAAGLPLAVRLRGTDEGPAIGWHRLTVDISGPEAQALGRRYGLQTAPGTWTLAGALTVPRIERSLYLYEYSKSPTYGPLGLLEQRRAGWDVTASLAADRASATTDAAAAVVAGFRLAVPVAMPKGSPIPSALTIQPDGWAQPLTIPTVDGDTTDHRWSDPGRVAVILRTKRSRGAGPAAAGFSLSRTDQPQRLADGMISLAW